MAVFQYEVLDNGSRREGVLSAASAAEAGANLRRQDLVVLKLEEMRSASEDHPERVERSALERRVAGALTAGLQVEQAMRQLAALLTAGVPILSALNAVAGQAPCLLSRALYAIAHRVRGGTPLGESIEEEAPFLGQVTRGLVAVGEANGTLDEMCLYAADLSEKSRQVRNQVVQSFAYPAVVLLMTFAVGYFLIARVIPKITAFIAQRAGELPWVTQALVDVSGFFKAYGTHCVVAPVALGVVLYLARKSPELGRQIDRAVLSIPLLGKAFVASGNAMWCRTLGILMRSGVNIISALSLTQGTLKNQHYRAQFTRLRTMVHEGQPLSAGIEVTALGKLCPMARAMVSVGEGTGTIDDGLLHVAKFSEEQLSRRVTLLAKLIEPVLFIVVGGMVAFVYFAFYLGLMAATRSVGR